MADSVKAFFGDLVTDGAYSREQHEEESAKKAVDRGHAAQAKLDQKERGIQVGGHDPASIKEHDNWESWGHEDLYTFRDSVHPDRINSVGRAWQSLGQRLQDLLGNLEKETRDAAGAGLQGQGAEAAIGAARPMQDHGKSFGDAVRMTGLKKQEAGAGAEQTKTQIQPPAPAPSVPHMLGTAAMAPATGGLAPAIDAGSQLYQRNEDAKQARAVMQNVYTPTYSGVDHSTPQLPPPQDPVNPPPPPAAPGQPGSPGGPGGSGSPGSGGSVSGGSSSGGSGGSEGSGDSGGGSPHSGGGSSPSAPPAPSGSAWAPGAPAPAPGGAAPSPGASTPSGQPPAGFAGAMPGGMGGGAGSGAGGSSGGGGKSAGGAGSGGGAGKGAGGGVGAGGRASSGGLGGGAGAAGGGAGSAAGGRGGAPMVGGMGAPGAGGRGGGDEEHERPSWLQENDDVFMSDMPATAPAVFGDWENS